jgi:hypothetical protein
MLGTAGVSMTANWSSVYNNGSNAQYRMVADVTVLCVYKTNSAGCGTATTTWYGTNLSTRTLPAGTMIVRIDKPRWRGLDGQQVSNTPSTTQRLVLVK